MASSYAALPAGPSGGRSSTSSRSSRKSFGSGSGGGTSLQPSDAGDDDDLAALELAARPRRDTLSAFAFPGLGEGLGIPLTLSDAVDGAGGRGGKAGDGRPKLGVVNGVSSRPVVIVALGQARPVDAR